MPGWINLRGKNEEHCEGWLKENVPRSGASQMRGVRRDCFLPQQRQPNGLLICGWEALYENRPRKPKDHISCVKTSAAATSPTATTPTVQSLN